jgi:CheY-like chemotaxis protein
MLTQDQFISNLRSALNHLYDPEELRDNPLAEVLGVANQMNAYLALQRLLVDAIDKLKSANSDGRDVSKNAQVHDLLFYRYVQQFNQSDVAVQLNISLRQYHRIKDRAITVLTAWLYEHHALNLPVEAELALAEQVASDTPVDAEISPVQAIQNELAWIQNLPQGSSSEFGEVFPTVPRLIQPLAEQRRVSIRWAGSEIFDGTTTVRVAIHPMALKLLLVALLNIGIVQVEQGELVCSARLQGTELILAVLGATHLPDMDGEVRGLLEMVRTLCKLGSGSLTTANQPDHFEIKLTLPTTGQQHVLVVDDNPDALQLFQRYLTNTPYHFIGSDNPEAALDMAIQHAPRVIVLDVMMPQLDGWELLGRIRSHPQTAHIPVLVCTILAQEPLAESLGAFRLLRKPVTRQCFLEALDRCVHT